MDLCWNHNQHRIVEGTIVKYPDIPLRILGKPGCDRVIRQRSIFGHRSIETLTGCGFLIKSIKALQVGTKHYQAVTPGGKPDPPFAVDE